MAPRKAHNHNVQAEDISEKKTNEESKELVMDENDKDWSEENVDIAMEADDDKTTINESKVKAKRGRPTKSRWEEQEEEEPKNIIKKVENGIDKIKTENMEVGTQTYELPIKPKLFNSIDQKWKLARPKYGVFNFKCDECREENFKMGNTRFQLHPYFKINHNGALPAKEPRWIQIESYCDDCVKLNLQITDLIMKHGTAKKMLNGQFSYLKKY